MFFKDKMEKLLEKAGKEVKNQQYAKARNTYLECLAIKPNDIRILNNLAQLSDMLGDTDKARGYNEIVLKECDEQLKYEKTEQLLILKSNALVSLKRNDDAIRVIDDLLEISPDHPLGLFHKASISN